MGGGSLFLSDRLMLRDVSWGDLEARRIWWEDADVTRHLGLSDGRQVARRRVRGQKPSMEWTIALREGGEPIGIVQLGPIDQEAEEAWLGLVIGRKDLWGQGFGRETVGLILQVAFDVVGLRRVRLEVEARHRAACRLYERSGFRRDGERGGAGGTLDGEAQLLEMSVTREDWDRRREMEGDGPGAGTCSP